MSANELREAASDDDFADAVRAIDVPGFVEDCIEQFRAICRRDPDRGGGHRERGKAADALRDAIRRAIYDAEQRTALDADDGEYERAIEDAAKCIPTTWLDPLLTGPSRVIPTEIAGVPVQDLLNALRERIRALSPKPVAPISPEIRARMDADRAAAELLRAPSVALVYWFADDVRGNPCLWWRNPWSQQPETLAMFQWPAHPVEWDVDAWWADLTVKIVAAINAKPVAPKPAIRILPITPEDMRRARGLIDAMPPETKREIDAHIAEAVTGAPKPASERCPGCGSLDRPLVMCPGMHAPDDHDSTCEPCEDEWHDAKPRDGGE